MGEVVRPVAVCGPGRWGNAATSATAQPGMKEGCVRPATVKELDEGRVCGDLPPVRAGGSEGCQEVTMLGFDTLLLC